REIDPAGDDHDRLRHRGECEWQGVDCQRLNVERAPVRRNRPPEEDKYEQEDVDANRPPVPAHESPGIQAAARPHSYCGGVHTATSLAFGSVARGKPCFPRGPPSSGMNASARAPLRSPRASKSRSGETSGSPPPPSTCRRARFPSTLPPLPPARAAP